VAADGFQDAGGFEGGAGVRIVRHQSAVILPLTGELPMTADQEARNAADRAKAEKEGFEPSMEAFTPITP